ncbi:MAG TPA: prephenate dehydratase, partial [Candidatus Nanopelagicales bacterium]|nr:prephenate dehydratase [Candidatus Nanopelagicales bacterium]
MSGQALRYAYLGPRGTFAESALRALPAGEAAEAVPAPDVIAALESVRRGEVDGALVPLENSIEGVVPTTVDDLAAGEPLVIIGEMAIPVRFALLARPGTETAGIRRVASHPHALAQCRGWITVNLPGVETVTTDSTAGAAQRLGEGDADYDAAIAARVAGPAYGLVLLHDSIGDNDEAWTRFVLVARPGQLPEPTGADKTTLCLFMRENHPGALLEILTEFSVRGVNLTRIESRPTRRALGDYYFSVDFEGHV